MDAIWIMVVSFVGYVLAYNTYGRFLARKIFRLRDHAAVPSRELEDGVDYVPTRKGVIFGHHYTSIAGTGPIVGPAIGIIWGWVPAMVWVFVGSIVMGAVHDFGSLVISLRNEGKSMAEITGRYINGRARTLFFLVVFLELLIVVAIFGVVIALVFARFPQAVFPVWCEVPIAVLLGLGIAGGAGRGKVFLGTLMAVALMYATVVAGHKLPLEMPAMTVGGTTLPPVALWVGILLVYAYIASSIRVTTLLQPRDYINAWQLFIATGLLIAGIVGAHMAAGGLKVVAPAYNPGPTGAPPMWPFLMVVIACGAISGFHSLVASGTTPKQIRTERDSLFVGYGSMLMEAALATLVIVAVAAGIGLAYESTSGATLTGTAAWNQHYASWTAAKGLGSKITAVVVGSANMIATLGISKGLAIVIIGVFIASFAGTTLDTATRLQRYVVSEIATEWRMRWLANRWVATALAVITAGLLAFAARPAGKGLEGLGTGALVLWPMFGAVNQLLAALALFLVTLYLRRKFARAWLLTLLPCLFMLVMTLWAVVHNEVDFVTKQNWTLVAINGLTLALAVWVAIEAFVVLLRGRGPQARGATEYARAGD
ncbi:MAG: carbon starvation protein A [Phycisphaerae bacterium]|nr:carbon starvation protein A [Phycisphaerae bacterium]